MVSLGIQKVGIMGYSILIISQVQKPVDLEEKIAGKLHKHVTNLVQHILNLNLMHIQQDNNKMADTLEN